MCPWYVVCFPIYKRISSWTVSSPSPTARSRTGALVELTPLHTPQAAEQSKPFFSVGASLGATIPLTAAADYLKQWRMCWAQVGAHRKKLSTAQLPSPWLTIYAFSLLPLMIHPQTLETGSSWCWRMAFWLPVYTSVTSSCSMAKLV